MQPDNLMEVDTEEEVEEMEIEMDSWMEVEMENVENGSHLCINADFNMEVD